MDIISETSKKIKEVKIQGATMISKIIVEALRIYSEQVKAKSVGEFKNKMRKARDVLLSQRPTEPMSRNACKFIFASVKNKRSVESAKEEFQKSCSGFVKIIEEARRKISFYGARMIGNSENILTHCHSSLVEESFKVAKETGKKFYVFNTETRPLLQGRITARNLLKMKIPVTMVTDSSAAFLISRYSGKKLMMQRVIIGSDAILEDGSVINKIGSFGISLVSFYEKVPLYVITSLLKFSPAYRIKIEKRPAGEVWYRAPQGLKVINFAFDIVPNQFIANIVCEAGIIRPQEVKQKVKAVYPWI